MKITVIIPVFNEENYIKKILKKIKELNYDFQTIVVNDGSTDHTREIILNNPSLYHDFIDLKKNSGKGSAIQEGIKKIKGDIVIIQDADLEYDPADYCKLIEPFKDENIMCVYGSRVLPGAKRIKPKTLSFAFRTLANFLLTFLSNLVNDQKLTDAHTCYKVFRSNLIKDIQLVEKGFNFCPEITAKVSQKGVKIFEVPISYKGRTHSEGKKIKFIDGFRAIKTIIYYNLFKK